MDKNGDRLNGEEEWIHYYREELRVAYFERIFICIGIVAILLGSIISIWTKFDPDFRNLHKPARNENDLEMSRVPTSDPSSDPLMHADDQEDQDADDQE